MARIDVEEVAPVPMHFRCPITLDIMKDPVTTSTGITYDRASIETWLDTGHRTCPATGGFIDLDELIPNHSLRRMIQNWCVAHREYGVERIPTPRVPINISQATQILSDTKVACSLRDKAQVDKLAVKIKNLVRESDRNRHQFISAGAAAVLAASFSSFTSPSILSAMTCFLPLENDETRGIFTTRSCVKAIISILSCGDLEGRMSAVLLIRELLMMSDNQTNIVAIVTDDERLVELLLKMIKEMISPRSTKAALEVIFCLISHKESTIGLRLVDAGLVPLILELIVDAERSTCEKGLAVFDEVLSSGRGREAAREHGLAVPVMVKKMFRVSELGSELIVSALWKMLKGAAAAGRVAAVADEVVAVGGFQKMLMLLQVECGRETKEKATDVLKMLNCSRGRLECFEQTDFRVLRRPLMR